MRIRTPRLLLRDFVTDDWADVLAGQRDPRYLRLYRWSDRTEADAQGFVGMFLDQQEERPRTRFQLVITLPDSRRLIGNCGIRRKSGNDHEADIGYDQAPDYWGNGYVTEAARAMVDFGFNELVHRR